MTKTETDFLNRVAEVLVANPTFTTEEAMRAVLDRDQQLWLEVAMKTEVGKAIADKICRSAYAQLRAA